MGPRQLIVCCDGTNSNLTGRVRDTNVSQLCELLDPVANQQLMYYDPGVGNPGSLPAATTMERFTAAKDRLLGLAFGSVVYENVAQAYIFLMRNWRPGDQIWLFGFSRGAFTVRSLGGLVTLFGILRPDADVLVPTLINSYFLKRDTADQKAHFQAVRDQIAQNFTAHHPASCEVWFVGVWDTVASVGLPLPGLKREISADPTIVGKPFRHVRHALALDEHRWPFKPRPYVVDELHDYAAHGQSIAQRWFRGSHGDVGGGYPNAQAGLSRQTLQWMLGEAIGKGLRLRAFAPNKQHEQEQVIGASTSFLDQRSRQVGDRLLKVHSATHDSAAWALSGMMVRNPLHSHPHISRCGQACSDEAPEAAAWAARMPADTAWSEGKSTTSLLVGLLLAVLAYLACGLSLIWPSMPATWDAALQDWGTTLRDLYIANNQFALWQLGQGWLWQPISEPSAASDCANLLCTSAQGFVSPRGALLADLVLIGAYAYLVARASSWAFARVAGLRRLHSPTRPWLQRLGMAPMALVLSDLTENLLSLLVLNQFHNEALPTLGILLGIAMVVAALAKWLGAAAVMTLLIWGSLSRPDARS
jgi:uncharacterized protein (DUF2235 family)